MIIKSRKKEGKFKSNDVVVYLKEENAFLRGEVAKLTTLCLKLAGNNNNNTLDNTPAPRMQHPTPTNIRQEIPCESTSDTTFHLPRRTAPLRTPTKNTWEPNITLTNAYSALSIEECMSRTSQCVKARAQRGNNECIQDLALRLMKNTCTTSCRLFLAVSLLRVL